MHKVVRLSSSKPLPFLKIANMLVSSITHIYKKIQVAGIREIQIKTTMRYLTQDRTVIRKNNTDDTGRRRKCSSLWWECVEDSMDGPHTIEIDVACAPDIRLLGTHSQKLKPT